MTANDPTTSQSMFDSEEGRLFEALREYQAALDQGNPPDREQFLARYVEVADDLADCLDNLEFLRNVAPQLDDSFAEQTAVNSTISPATVRSKLGDFSIVREIGRGGMGVVYEAEQMSMSRRVALKVLPFASVLDQKILQRFRSEAQIAGQLVHQNIVPVYSVGCEQGVHYYAMQYIEGQTLSELITELRDGADQGQEHVEEPSTDKHFYPKSQASTSPAAVLSTARSNASSEYVRSAAELMGQVARALAYAHGQGVIHRDIKPSNLMVDDQGKVWVTDFGLAHVETGPSITITGDFLGTLRYMSPEQAMAQRVVVDHRTDIYSLGLTLYELLTQRPAFTGESRQELLRQITFESPHRPRRVNPAIPADLETILLKSIEKKPDRSLRLSGSVGR